MQTIEEAGGALLALEDDLARTICAPPDTFIRLNRAIRALTDAVAYRGEYLDAMSRLDQLFGQKQLHDMEPLEQSAILLREYHARRSLP